MKTPFSISAFIVSFLFLPFLFPLGQGLLFAQLQVTANNNPTQLAQTLAGAGVTVSGATMNCPSLASPANNPTGTFVGTSSNIGIPGGILLTSGDIMYAVGPNIGGSSGVDNQFTFNDPDLMLIDPNAINDVCIVEFDAVPTCSTLAFTFAFGSDEYPEFVNSFNDAFGIFVTGTNPSGPNYTGYNMARIPVSLVPVSINNVNNGNYACPGPPTGPCTNCAYYIDNCSGTTVEYDGFTSPITVTLNVVPCSSYHFKLAVADALDHIYDTGVFFAMQSLVCATSLTVTASSQNATCVGNNGTGTVTSVTGGAAPYAYVWSTTPAQSTQTATGLSPGTYTVTAIDANGCLTGTQTVTILGGGVSFSVTATPVNATCFGNNNGSASITNPTGGTAPYTYAWSVNPVQTTPAISNIPSGNYTCTITDAAGCVQTATLTVTQPPAITGSVTATTNVSCNGGNNGSATASGSGGTGTINYSWNTTPAQAGATANNLSAGNYIVTITDANGCTLTQTATITQPTQMAVTTSSTPSDCGVQNGTATVTSSGGVLPYTYMWNTSPAQTLPTAINLGGGTYNVIVIDANGCTQQQSVLVAGGLPPVAGFYFPSEVISTLDPFVLFLDGSTGNPALWNWNFGDTSSGANNSSVIQNPSHIYTDPGIYCITQIVSDPTGICADTLVKCLKVEAPYTFYIPSAFTPNNDAFNELFKGEGTNIKTFNIMIFDRWGNKVFESNDINTGWNGKVKNRSGTLVQEDVYVWKVTITDIYDRQHKYIGNVTMVK
ncbi:MAG: choice-of-anchor L domain-containing protein [Bacteroidetes bacterium]|nr:choice-of-anchor L domain-containing protein [Bacteroidota bacterium]